MRTRIIILTLFSFLMMQSGSGSLVTHSTDDSGEMNTTIERTNYENMWHSVCSPAEDALISVFDDLYLIPFNEPDGTWMDINDPAAILSDNIQGYDYRAVMNLIGEEITGDHSDHSHNNFLVLQSE